MRQLPIAFFAATLMASPTLADGLIYQLPPDGSWVTYKSVYRATEVSTLKGVASPDIKGHGTLTLRSVGVGTVGKEPARWIELEAKWPPEKGVRAEGRIIAWKALIPNAVLGRNADPLKNITELHFIDRNWVLGKEPKQGVPERIEDPARIAYEIERFRQEFPFPPTNPPAESPSSEIKTPLKTFSAIKISYPTKFEGKLTGGKGGRLRWEGDYSLWLSKDAPFGVVAVESTTTGDEEYATADTKGVYHLNGDGMRFKTFKRLELEASGTGAKSAFPVDKEPR